MAGNIAAARDYGFHGVAVLGSVWETTDPVLAYQELADACKAASKE
jgi:thiamine monophosphate synthase